jgi:uncharacterized protein YjbI with pentapeptide repeats
VFDASSLRLDDVSLRESALGIFKISEADVQRSKFDRIQGKALAIERSSLKSVSFDNCRWNKVSVEEGELEHVTFTNCDAHSFDLHGVTIKGCKFAQERGVVLTTKNVNFINCDFLGARLSGSRFVGGTVLGTWWAQQALDGVTFQDVTFADGGDGLSRALVRPRESFWTTRPVFLNCSGISGPVLERLRASGMIFKQV